LRRVIHTHFGAEMTILLTVVGKNRYSTALSKLSPRDKKIGIGWHRPVPTPAIERREIAPGGTVFCNLF
jgi:hypothetical protein